MSTRRSRVRTGLLVGLSGLVLARLLRKAVRYELEGRVVLITGGSRGLGSLLARELGRAGARVAICARDPDTLERAREDLDHRGARVLALRCDVADRSQVDQLVSEVRKRLGPIDVLVNNAGVIEVGPVATMTLEDFHEALGTNFWGPLHTIWAVLPDMRRRGGGRIVNVASIGGKVSVPHLLPYSASKFALVGLSEGLRAELAKDGILVTTICPGLMRTGSPRHARFKGDHRAEHAWVSVADALPFVSMDADRAARRIVAALRDGAPGRTLSLPGKLLDLAHALAPGLVVRVLGVANRLLPDVGAIGAPSRFAAKGEASASAVSPSWLTTLADRAAVRNNQGAGSPGEDR